MKRKEDMMRINQKRKEKERLEMINENEIKTKEKMKLEYIKEIETEKQKTIEQKHNNLFYSIIQHKKKKEDLTNKTEFERIDEYSSRNSEAEENIKKLEKKKQTEKEKLKDKNRLKKDLNVMKIL